MLKIVIYSNDTIAVNTLKSLLNEKAEIVIPEKEGDLEVGHLGIVDHSYPHNHKLLEKLRQVDDGIIIAVMSYNPFAVAQLMPYNIDAFLAKPLSTESVHALVIGAQSRSGVEAK